MKKLLSILLAGVLVVGATGCSSNDSAESSKIVVGATVVPHAELLNLVKEDLLAEGIELEVQEFSDYSLLNPALVSGDLDANFFQHQPFLDQYNADANSDLVSLGGIHVEPLRVYSNKITSVDDLADGDTVGLSNDATNEGRALLLLQSLGVITLDPEAGLTATPKDIVENPKNLEFVELDPFLLPPTLDDLAIALISTNIAIEGGLDINSSIAVEGSDSEYVNIIAVKNENKDNPNLVKLIEALQSDKVATYIEENYDGSVVAAFTK
ncbi:MAG: MetQ/NlpA family ABC transporter substrate-binding protein [Lachnospirales bacterium]